MIAQKRQGVCHGPASASLSGTMRCALGFARPVSTVPRPLFAGAPLSELYKHHPTRPIGDNNHPYEMRSVITGIPKKPAGFDFARARIGPPVAKMPLAAVARSRNHLY